MRFLNSAKELDLTISFLSNGNTDFEAKGVLWCATSFFSLFTKRNCYVVPLCRCGYIYIYHFCWRFIRSTDWVPLCFMRCVCFLFMFDRMHLVRCSVVCIYIYIYIYNIFCCCFIRSTGLQFGNSAMFKQDVVFCTRVRYFTATFL